ncbi:helix-turn-helix domain-containing protein [Haloarchaeobius amylolyticus]|uniref:helix-turn-helix domain-containing protein n=1 Tax=Haloarchaeobius amylolyticus TaxID=1198296 RepID=UPI00226E94A6|nr:helix-turn-helix domain-containing protein [Haloarchaeobius amylolyticus]
MKYLSVTLRHSDETIHPMHAFVSEHGGYSDYRLVHWSFANDEANALLFHVRGDRAAYEDRLVEVESVRSYEVAPLDEDRFYVYVLDEPDETSQQMLSAFSKLSLVPVPPLSYHTDRSVSFGILGEPDALQAALDATPEGIDVSVDRLGSYDADPTAAGVPLTPRQREAVQAAQRLGYYDVPRDAAVADVADELGCATGTAAEHLRKAESTLLGDLDC